MQVWKHESEGEASLSSITLFDCGARGAPWVKSDCAIGYRAERSIYATPVEKGVDAMQLFVNKKEAPALISALEDYIIKHPQCKEAQELLSRVIVCLEKQGKSKNKANR